MSCFTVLSNDQITNARTGRLRTAHGQVTTPVFMPVGTRAAVRGVAPDRLRECKASIILGNAFHLFLSPGTQLLEQFGGIHAFMKWQGPVLTDSGGFQVFSLSEWRKITEKGVAFRSPIDGRKCFLGPEESVRIQESIGSDIAMCFDECPALPAEPADIRQAVQRTLRWAGRCRTAHTRTDQLLFGITQGGLDVGLRRECLDGLTQIGFDGYAIGGLSVGEPPPEMYRVLEAAVPDMPQECPRYLMGVGTPEDLLEAVGYGVDMFDCVMPTRNARNGLAFSWNGRVRILKSDNRTDKKPIDKNCECYTCRNFSLAYLRHLFKVNDFLGKTLVSIHNIFFYQDLMRGAREAIDGNRYRAFRDETVKTMQPKEKQIEKRFCTNR
mgnify:CR=1 FL=1